MNVELIYDADCPNVTSMRSLLIKAFASTGVSARWKEWERTAPDSPEYARTYGSPTILVDGEDIAGTDPVAGFGACRVYADPNGALGRTPSMETLSSALLRASSMQPAKTRWQAMAASAPAIGVALLPKLTCPLCFPAYAALLSALGLEFVNYTPYLLPLTFAFLTIALGVLVFQARRTGNLAALALAVVATGLVLAGKFYFESDWLSTGGALILVAAIFLGIRSRSTATVSCPACVAGGNDKQVKAH